MPSISIIIINWNTQRLLSECLQSIRVNCQGLEPEVIVVDNASSDGSVAMLQQEYPEVRVIQNQTNVGFARANNQAMQASTGEYLLLLNSDACLLPGALEKLLEFDQIHPDAGIVGAMLVNPDNSFQASFSGFPNLWREALILTGLGRLLFGKWFPSHGPEVGKGPQPADYVEGACLFVRRTAYDQVGGLDESFFMYSEEVDWCYRMKQAGWPVWYQPEARVLHYGGASSAGRRTQREGDLYWSRVHFFRKHHGAAAANLLKLLILGLTTLKYGLHLILRFFTKGRSGRPVISLRALSHQLKNA